MKQVRLSQQLAMIAVSVSALAIVGCTARYAGDESSAFYSVPAGSMLTLNRDVTIAANKVAIYVQQGELLQYDDVDFYWPNCKFEIYTMSEQPRQVQAGRFEIRRVVDEVESSSLLDGLQVAGLMAGTGMIDRSYMYNYASMMYLHSQSQPDVYRMTCQHWEDMTVDRYLSIAQMRQAMGEVFTLEIK